MNCVLSKLKSLFDNFNHISIWPNSLQKHMNKALQYLKHEILVPGLHIENVKFQTVVFQLTYH